MTMPKFVDVLVVGARCAGAASAMLMARKGLSVLLVDRSAYGSDTVSTHALMRGGVLQLARWGLLPAVHAAGTPVVRQTTFHYGNDAVAIPVKPIPGMQGLAAPRRWLLDRLLVDAAGAAGVAVRHGVTLTGLLRDADGRVTGARLCDAGGDTVEVNCGLLVGADGLSSSVARLVDAPVKVEGRHSTATLFGYFPGLANDGYHWHYGEGVSAGAIPTIAGHCVFAAGPTAAIRSRLRADPVQTFRDLLAAAAPALTAKIRDRVPAAGLKVFAGRRGIMRQPHGPGWALVGDAGYFRDPVTAHGITDALRDAELLAEAAVEGTPAAFRHYAEVRDTLARSLFEATDAIAAKDWDLARLRDLHGALNAAMKTEVAWMTAHWPAPTADAGNLPSRPLPILEAVPT